MPKERVQAQVLLLVATRLQEARSSAPSANKTTDMTGRARAQARSESCGAWPCMDELPAHSGSDSGTTSSGSEAERVNGSVSSRSRGSVSSASSTSSTRGGPLGKEGLQAVLQLISLPQSGREQLRAMGFLLKVCRDPSNTRMVGQLGAIELLVGLLRQALDVATTSGPDALRHPVVCLALETLALLTAETGPHKDALRRAGGVPALVAMLDAPLHLHYRAVLAVRIFTEREIDRQAVLLCGGLPKLVALMGEHSKAETRQVAQSMMEVLENATAAVGNLAAGSQALKNGLRSAGAIAPLVRLLDGDEILAELSAVALRNLSMRNQLNRQVILDAGGLEPLLRLLSKGQHRLASYWECVTVSADGAQEEAICWFDISYGQLSVVPKSAESSKPGWIPALFTPRGSQRRPDPASADVYSLLNKFRMSEPCGSTLEIKFHRQRGGVATPGVTPIQSGNTSSPDKPQLAKILIRPCPATELKGAILKMMTRVHLEREFRRGGSTDTPPSAGARTGAQTDRHAPSSATPLSASQSVDSLADGGALTARTSLSRQRSSPLSASVPDWKTLKAALFQAATPRSRSGGSGRAGLPPKSPAPGSTPRGLPTPAAHTVSAAGATPGDGRPPMPALNLSAVKDARHGASQPSRTSPLAPSNRHCEPSPSSAGRRPTAEAAKENLSPIEGPQPLEVAY
eukprot:jgi/Tetstr1/422143/TSEL_012998.t1